MGVVRNLMVRVGADINPLQRNMGQAQRSVTTFQRSVQVAANNTSLSMQSMAGALTMGRLGFIALGAAAVASFALVGKNAIKAAMDVVESESLFSVSMGSMASSARAWSDQLQASLGLNAYEVRKNVGIFYNMTTSMGLARDAAYKLSTEMTELAYDMASFYNMPVEDMFTKLQAGLTGETEPLKRIGILVLENVANQYAYAAGIANVGEALTEQQKVMARYLAIMGQTKNAQGDLARTIMSPTNQLRIFRMQLQLAAVNLGNAFMPVVTYVLPVLTNFAKGLVRVTNTFAQFSRALFGANSVQAVNAQSAADAAAAQTALGNATKKAGDKAKKGVAGFDQLNMLQESIAASAADAADAMDAQSTTPTPAKGADNGSIIPQSLLDAAANVRKALEPLSKPFNDFRESLANLGESIAKNPHIIAWFERFKTDLKNTGKGGILALGGALDILSGAINLASGALSGNFEQSLKGAEQAVSGTFDIVTGIMYPFFPNIANKMQEFKKDFGQKWASLKDDVKLYGDPAKLEAADFGNYIRDKVSEKWDELKVNTSTKWGEIKTVMGEKWKEIKDISWGDVKTKVSGHWDDLKKDTGTKWEELKTIMDNKWKSISGMDWSTTKTRISNTWRDLKTDTEIIWGGMKQTVKNSINGMLEHINSLIRRINGLGFQIPPLIIAGKTIFGGADISFPDIPQIPMLAAGGEINRPTLAMMGENRKKEVVLPLEDSSMWAMMASTVSAAVASALAANQSGGQNQNRNDRPLEIILKLGDTELARSVIKTVNDYQRQTGESLLFG